MEAHELTEQRWKAEEKRERSLYDAGRLAERSRIRRELLDAIETRSFLASAHPTKGRVVLVAVMRLTLERILPEEG